ncbi:hypothetical protein OROMI_009006 [Orobanche minor]
MAKEILLHTHTARNTHTHIRSGPINDRPGYEAAAMRDLAAMRDCRDGATVTRNFNGGREGVVRRSQIHRRFLTEWLLGRSSGEGSDSVNFKVESG